MTVRLRAAAAALALALLPVGGCAGKKRSGEAQILEPSERYELGLEALGRRDLRKANTLLTRVDYYSGEDRQALEPLVRLALADSTFYQGTDLALISARSLYLDFVTLFGDHPLAPYAQFQAGMCSLSQVRHPSRDQTQTLEAIQDLRTVETRYPASGFAIAASLMRRTAESNLVEHEIIVGKFYLKRKAYLAAAERFRKILTRYPDTQEKETVYFYLGQALLSSKNSAEARIYLSKLLADYPDGRFVEQARKALADAGGSPDLQLDSSP